jgi:hypothetical protein
MTKDEKLIKILFTEKLNDYNYEFLKGILYKENDSFDWKEWEEASKWEDKHTKNGLTVLELDDHNDTFSLFAIYPEDVELFEYLITKIMGTGLINTDYETSS